MYLNPELANILPEDHKEDEDEEGRGNRDGSGSGSGSGGNSNDNRNDGRGGSTSRDSSKRGADSSVGGSLGGVSDRSSFNLYGIPQTLYKLNAEFDVLIKGI